MDLHLTYMTTLMFMGMLTKDAVARHEPIQCAEATQLMYDFLVDPAVSQLPTYTVYLLTRRA